MLFPSVFMKCGMWSGWKPHVFHYCFLFSSVLDGLKPLKAFWIWLSLECLKRRIKNIRCSTQNLGGGFNHFFMFTPTPAVQWSNLIHSYYSIGLKLNHQLPSKKSTRPPRYPPWHRTRGDLPQGLGPAPTDWCKTSLVASEHWSNAWPRTHFLGWNSLGVQ